MFLQQNSSQKCVGTCKCTCNPMEPFPEILKGWTATHVIRFARTKVSYNLRDDQVQAILAILHGKSTLVVAHTGWGKSLVFHVAIAIMNQLASCSAVIVTPTIALMQVRTARCSNEVYVTCNTRTGSRYKCSKMGRCHICWLCTNR